MSPGAPAPPRRAGRRLAEPEEESELERGLRHSPLAALFGLVPLPAQVLAIVALVTLADVVVSEATKHRLAAWSGRRAGLTTSA